jgi:hypothetical protein
MARGHVRIFLQRIPELNHGTADIVLLEAHHRVVVELAALGIACGPRGQRRTDRKADGRNSRAGADAQRPAPMTAGSKVARGHVDFRAIV